MAPFANRFSGSMFATGITRIMWGRSSPGQGRSFAHWPARFRLVRHWDRVFRVILAMFRFALYQELTLDLALNMAFTFSRRLPRAAMRFKTRRFRRLR